MKVNSQQTKMFYSGGGNGAFIISDKSLPEA